MPDETSDMHGSRHRRGVAAALTVLTVLAGVAWLHGAGRVAWCACRQPTWFVANPATSHNSQHVFDWYSFSHLLHGVIFLWGLTWALPWLATSWKLLVAVVMETFWEIVENSPWVIQRYRDATASLGYEGDSIANSVGDILFCIGGFFLARAIGWKWSLALFGVIELVMLAAIRDNLTLNVIMLLYPLESIRQWQLGLMGGAAG